MSNECVLPDNATELQQIEFVDCNFQTRPVGATIEVVVFAILALAAYVALCLALDRIVSPLFTRRRL